MRRYMLIISAILLVLSNGVPAQAETSQFDGTWNVTLTCERALDAPEYTYKIVAQVKDGMLLGQYGEENKPGYLKITGQIEPNGSSMLQATGEVGKAIPKGSVSGRAYSYAVTAQFKNSQGTGSRILNKENRRHCDFVFVKK